MKEFLSLKKVVHVYNYYSHSVNYNQISFVQQFSTYTIFLITIFS